MKVQLKFFFPVLIKIKSFREASSHISSPYLKRKNFGGKQNFPPKSCFPNSETKRANSTASVEKACLNYRKIIRQQQIYQLLTHFRLPAKLCPKCNEAQQHILFLRWKLDQIHHNLPSSKLWNRFHENCLKHFKTYKK